MAAMKEDLKLLLRRSGVHDDVCAWLAASPQDCHEMKIFANIVDDGIAEHALDEPLDAETRRSKYTVLWTAVQESMFAVLRRPALPTKQADEPLAETRRSKYTVLWTLRESMFAVLRRPALPTKQEASRFFSHLQDDVSVLEDTSKLGTYFASSGHLEPVGQLPGATMSLTMASRLSCHWQDVCTYIGHLEGKAWSAIESLPEELVLSYILQTEEKIRATAVERCQNEGMPWGRALLHAWKEDSQLWPDAKDEWLNRRPPARKLGAGLQYAATLAEALQVTLQQQLQHQFQERRKALQPLEQRPESRRRFWSAVWGAQTEMGRQQQQAALDKFAAAAKQQQAQFKPISSAQVKETLKHMGNKAPGADAWTVADLRSLPDDSSSSSGKRNRSWSGRKHRDRSL
ncbi:unnamed protein product [Symbiodinium sp. CCMP2456]|nr:unnamed protein product [Symbiodinium sp. CCMP2456]